MGCAGGPLVHRRAEPLRIDKHCRAQDLQPGERITLKVQGQGWVRGVYEGLDCADPRSAILLLGGADSTRSLPGPARITLSEVDEIRKSSTIPEGIGLAQAALLGAIALCVVIALAGGLNFGGPS